MHVDHHLGGLSPFALVPFLAAAAAFDVAAIVLGSIASDQVATWLGGVGVAVTAGIGLYSVVTAGRSKVVKEQIDRLTEGFEDQINVLKTSIKIRDNEIAELHKIISSMRSEREHDGGR